MAGRATAWVATGALLAAVAAAVGISLATAPVTLPFPPPPPADAAARAALHAAAAATLATGSFVADVTVTTGGAGSGGTEQEELVYRAPDRSELIIPSLGRPSLVAVGRVLYSRSVVVAGQPTWVACTEPPASSLANGGALATSTLDALGKAGDVVEVAGRYQAFLQQEHAPARQAAAPALAPGRVRDVLTATVAGGRVVSVVDVHQQPKLTTTVRTRYASLGAGPPVTVPTDALPCPPRPGG